MEVNDAQPDHRDHHRITGVITTRYDRELLAGGELHEAPTCLGWPDSALLAVCDEQGRPLAGVCVPDSLLL